MLFIGTVAAFAALVNRSCLVSAERYLSTLKVRFSLSHFLIGKETAERLLSAALVLGLGAA